MKKNGKIELLRFLFAIAILLRHINLKAFELNKSFGSFTLGKLGYIGVEFFFLVSGFFMARSIFKNNNKKSSDEYSSNWEFILKKIKAILPYHLMACIIMIIIIIFRDKGNALNLIMIKSPSLLLLQNTGILGNVKPLIASEWYLSAMFISMFIIYPFLKKDYNKFVYSVAPIISLLTIGYIVSQTGFLSGTSELLGFTFKANYRALGEICLGIMAFEISRKISDYKLNSQKIKLLKVFEFLCYLFVFIVMFTDRKPYFEVLSLIALFFGLIISTGLYSQKDEKIFNNKVTYFLGSISLPIYMFQEVVWVFVLKWINVNANYQALLMFVLTFFLAITSYIIVNNRKKTK